MGSQLVLLNIGCYEYADLTWGFVANSQWAASSSPSSYKKGNNHVISSSDSTWIILLLDVSIHKSDA